MPGLFIKSTDLVPFRTWPYILASESGVLNKYYLNMIIFRQTAGIKTPPYNHGLDDLQTNSYYKQQIDGTIGFFNTYVVDLPGDTTYLSSEPIYSSESNLIPSKQCLDRLYSVNVPGVFTSYADRKTVKLNANEREVFIDRNLTVLNL